MKDSHVILASGRELAYTDIGEPDWPTVFFFHGAPISRLHLAYLEQEFIAERIRVISPERPGYGKSSPQPGRSMADWPIDVAALADALEIDHFIVAGHSSGGPYAVACAAMLPARVSAGIILGGVTDMGWTGAWENYIDSEIQLMRSTTEEAAIAWCRERFGPDGSNFLTATDFDFPEPDNRLLADEHVGPMLISAITDAFRQGVAGYAQDIFVQGRPWPFKPDDVVAPVQVIHGEMDTLMPFTHSRHTAEVIPGATLRVLPGHAHLTTVSELPQLASAITGSFI